MNYQLLKNAARILEGSKLDEVGDRIKMARSGINVSISDHDPEGRLNSPESDDHYRHRILAEIDRLTSGGPAFGEFHQAGECSVKTGGMTLRDYFAAKAMQSIFALGESYDYGGNPPIDELPRHAYALADAMLRERAK